MSYGYNESFPCKPPFMWVEQETAVPKTAVCDNVAVLSFGAYNAMGLIGTEKGGVAIVHNEPNFVIATKDIPYKPDLRAEEHARIVEFLRFCPSRDALILGIKARGYDSRWE